MAAVEPRETPDIGEPLSHGAWERERAALIAECAARIERERRDRDETIGELLEHIAHLERAGRRR